MLRINKDFAKRYEQYRRKEELQKLKDKLGSGKVSDLKEAAAEAEASSSESEDSDAEAWTPGLEKGFLRVYAALSSGDKRIYDPSVKWFSSEEEGEEDGKVAEADEAEQKENGQKYKPMYYNEYQRNYVLQRGFENEDSDAASGAELQEECAKAGRGSDADEAERIRASISCSSAQHREADDDSEAEEFLVKREAALPGGSGQQPDTVQQLHSFLTESDDKGNLLPDDCKQDLSKLKQLWQSDAQLTDAERYLRDYVTKEFWRQPPKESLPTYSQLVDGHVSEASLSADEEFLTRQKEFETKWNNRTEEPDAEFEHNFQRTFASADKALGEEGQDEEDDDEELFVVKAPCNGEQQADEEMPAAILDELRRIESQRQWALDSELRDEPGISEEPGCASEEQIGDSGEATVKTFPRGMPDSLRQSAATSRARSRSERRQRSRAEKSARRAEIEQLVQLREEELQGKIQRLQRNAGTAAVKRQLDNEFLEADFDPDEHDRRMAAIFDHDFYGDGEGRPEFSDDDGDEAGLGGGADSQREMQLLREQLAEAEQQQAEDFIRAGPNEKQIACRFKYRSVEPNDFGLDPVEILLADDRELNAWCSIRKMSQYRQREAEVRDKRRYRSSKLQAKKQRLMPTMLQRLQEAESQQQPSASSQASGSQAPGKKRRKKRKRKQEAEVEAGGAVEEARSRQPRKRQRPVPEQQKQEIQQQKKQQEKQEIQQQKRQQQKQEIQQQEKELEKHEEQAPRVNGDKAMSNPASKPAKVAGKGKLSRGKQRLQISESRLRELGIEPKKFRRLQRLRAAAGSAHPGAHDA